jgi:hypothetical protein
MSYHYLFHIKIIVLSHAKLLYNTFQRKMDFLIFYISLLFYLTISVQILPMKNIIRQHYGEGSIVDGEKLLTQSISENRQAFNPCLKIFPI